MSESINKVILVGNLGKEPEVRISQFGKKMVTIQVATNTKWKDKETNTDKQLVEWHRVIIYNEHLANFASEYLKKGAKVYVEGRIQTKKWTDNNGIEHKSTDICVPNVGGNLVILSKFNNDSHHVGGYDYPVNSGPAVSNVPLDEYDDIPFI